MEGIFGMYMGLRNQMSGRLALIVGLSLILPQELIPDFKKV